MKYPTSDPQVCPVRIVPLADIDKELLVTFKNQLGPNQWEVAQLESGEDIGSALFPVASVTEELSEMTIRSVSVTASNVKVGETYPVYGAFADSPSKFFCQLVSENDKLEALMAEVGDFYSGNHLEVELTAGVYCVAQYSWSWSWYRAQITVVHSEEDIVVHFFDYENSEHVQSKQISVDWMPDSQSYPLKVFPAPSLKTCPWNSLVRFLTSFSSMIWIRNSRSR